MMAYVCFIWVLFVCLCGFYVGFGVGLIFGVRCVCYGLVFICHVFGVCLVLCGFYVCIMLVLMCFYVGLYFGFILGLMWV